MRIARQCLLVGVCSSITLLVVTRCSAEVTLDLGSASVRLDRLGHVIAVEPTGATPWIAKGPAAFSVDTQQGTLAARSVTRVGNQLTVNFGERVEAEFQLSEHPGYALFSLVRLQGATSVKRFRFFSLPLPSDARQIETINAARRDGWIAAVMGTKVNVVVPRAVAGVTRADRQGCQHQFRPDKNAKVGNQAARFTATSDNQPGGWSLRGKPFAVPLDLSGCTGLRLWVRGDGQGEQLKIQLTDGAGGYRDDYLTIDFTGWRQCALDHPSLNTLRYDRVAAVNFYFNNLPIGQTVSCGLDQVDALIGTGTSPRVVPLEDFESPTSALWASSVRTLDVETVAAHGVKPAGFALIVCPEEKFFPLLPEVQQAAGLPSPRPGGVWNKRSPWVQRSYLFLTNFSESDFEAGLALARRGGMDMILIGQQSWCESTGHYNVNRKHFPDGLPSLVRTVRRFQDAGFKVGLHFLAASISSPDPYLTPTADPRIVTGAAATLAGPVDGVADFLPTTAAPVEFPAEDGGYKGAGTILRLGQELIAYQDRSLQRPFGFRGCRRGHLGTRVSPHAAGDKVLHLVRSYGYHLVDMDTTLFDEVTTNLARVANACNVDMLYFDGAEQLQGDQDYYNGRLISGFYNKLRRKEILVQASSFGPYSWHIVARSASADGHGDLKGYLEQRSPVFDSFARRGMPLDIGWYYGYDPTCTPDMYEYVLGATIGYGASMSFQISPAAAARNPFTNEILDLIARYETLRLSGRVPPEMIERLRIDPALAGNRSPNAADTVFERRREYRLTAADGQDVFQRVVYAPWHELKPEDLASQVWTVQVPPGPVRVGWQVHVQPGQRGDDGIRALTKLDAAKVSDPVLEVDGQRLAWRGTLAAGQYLFLWPGERPVRFGAALGELNEIQEPVPQWSLPAGKTAVRFTCRNRVAVPLRVRLTFQPDERHNVPNARHVR